VKKKRKWNKMVDVIIKDVPIGAEEKVKEMAMVAIERFKKQSLVVPQERIKTFETEIDLIRKSNNLEEKYKKLTEEETIKVLPEKEEIVEGVEK
jgi:hypothetical protein